MISIVIPTLNEADYIERTLQCALEQEGEFEVIVADGGSADDTVERAGRMVKVVTSPPGRGLQQNRGAREARGNLLLFLHADTLLPEGALTLVGETMRDRDIVGGRFCNRFDCDHWLLKLFTASSRSERVPFWYGDQTIFARREVFDALGGFRPIPLMEDLDMGRRLRDRGRTVVIQKPVITSSRRFEKKGIIRTMLKMYLIFCLFFMGVSPYCLARMYGDVR